MNLYLLLCCLALSISTVTGHGYLKCPAGRQYRGKSVTVNNGKFNWDEQETKRWFQQRHRVLSEYRNVRKRHHTPQYNNTNFFFKLLQYFPHFLITYILMKNLFPNSLAILFLWNIVVRHSWTKWVGLIVPGSGAYVSSICSLSRVFEHVLTFQFLIQSFFF